MNSWIFRSSSAYSIQSHNSQKSQIFHRRHTIQMIYGQFFHSNGNYDNEKCIIDDKNDVIQNIQAIMRQLITRFGCATQTHDKNERRIIEQSKQSEEQR